MKYCQRCGSQVADEAMVCPVCGNGEQSNYSAPTENYSAPAQSYSVPQTKICPKCGHSIHIDAVICTNCGCSVETKPVEEDVPNTAISILSFLYPLVGFIFYALKNKETPISANKYLKLAIISIVVSIAFVFGVYAIMFLGVFFMGM